MRSQTWKESTQPTDKLRFFINNRKQCLYCGRIQISVGRYAVRAYFKAKGSIF